VGTGECAAPGERRPRWIVAVETASIAGFVLLFGSVLDRLFASAPPERLAWLLPVALVVGFAVADFVSGLVHWFADSCFQPGTPVLGPLLIEPFREHHRDPAGITRHGFLELSGNNALATLPLAGGLLLLDRFELFRWFEGGEAAFARHALQAGVTALALALFLTNTFHAWAHASRPPAAAVWLQRRGLLLSPEMHARHHRAEHDRSYCVTSGWLNPWLDRIRFFERLGALLRLRAGAP
jgi:ubiquitin-conjugating enzyme E2 variant